MCYYFSLWSSKAIPISIPCCILLISKQLIPRKHTKTWERRPKRGRNAACESGESKHKAYRNVFRGPEKRQELGQGQPRSRVKKKHEQSLRRQMNCYGLTSFQGKIEIQLNSKQDLSEFCELTVYLTTNEIIFRLGKRQTLFTDFGETRSNSTKKIFSGFPVMSSGCSASTLIISSN